MFCRKRACIVVGGTVGLVYVAVPELAQVYLTDDQGTGMTDDKGTRITTGADPSSEAARWRYDVWATVCLVPITAGMVMQVWEPFTIMTRNRRL